MMAAILNSAMLDSYTAILDSNTLLSSLRFTQKDSPSTLTLTQTNSIQLTRWWQPSWILPSWILPSWIQPFCTKRTSLIHFDSTWRWQPSWTLPSWILPLCTKKIFTHSFWSNLMMAAILNSAIFNSAILHKNVSSLQMWARWQGATICNSITKVKQLWARLILGWVTV